MCIRDRYKVGSVKFSGKKMFTDAEIIQGVKAIQKFQSSKATLGLNGLPMDVTDVFTPGGLTKDTEAVQDFYGSKGYIEIAQGQALHVQTVPNIQQGTMDLDFQVGECQKSYVQKIEIHGNLKTKDKVLRREPVSYTHLSNRSAEFRICRNCRTRCRARRT